MNFRERVIQDTIDPRNWFNPGEMAREFDIDGRKTVGVLTKYRPSVGEVLPETEGYSRAFFHLTLRGHEVGGVSAGQVIRIDGKRFMVRGYEDIHGAFYRIELERVDP